MESIISEADLRALKQIAQKNSCDKKHLQNILKRTTVVGEDELPKKTIRLNSLVVLWHSLLKKIVSIRIVAPDKADLRHRNISVFAPISMAILGLRERSFVKVRLGGIEKQLRILKVINE